MDDPFKPVYRRTTPQTWMNQIRWDPFGYGMYFSCCSDAEVRWDPMWASLNVPRPRSTVYTHNTTDTSKSDTLTVTGSVNASIFGCVWALKSVVYDEQTWIFSVSSNGSIRAVVPSSSMYRVRGEPSVAVGYEPGLFRLIESSGANPSNATIDSNVEQSRSKRPVVGVRLNGVPVENADRSIDNRLPSSHKAALHTVDITSFGSQSSDGQPSCLLAYGGASGLLRVHATCPLAEISDSDL